METAREFLERRGGDAKPRDVQVHCARRDASNRSNRTVDTVSRTSGSWYPRVMSRAGSTYSSQQRVPPPGRRVETLVRQKRRQRADSVGSPSADCVTDRRVSAIVRGVRQFASMLRPSSARDRILHRILHIASPGTSVAQRAMRASGPARDGWSAWVKKPPCRLCAGSRLRPLTAEDVQRLDQD
jgi:hypothetical protein